ncbi:(2Fe-2S)-binding protein [Streptomyces sp. NPDC048172]|uniref:(2Fe-2S)-binding protein n=1 Tax=Streptomyces sp. NPDC048172 TaxID=3365505 RepID=UPI00371211CF
MRENESRNGTENGPESRSPGEDVGAALREAARHGPFFALATGGKGAEAAAPAWRPLARSGPEALRPVIDSYAAKLRTDEPRVAASILFQALAARLWTPVLATATGPHRVVPDLAELRWRYAEEDGLSLWLPGPTAYGEGGGEGDPVAALHGTVVGALLRPLAGAFMATVKIAEPLLWGNAAAALAGTVHTAPAPARRRDRTAALVRALHALEPLRDAGDFTPGGYLRRSCCLYYRVPPGGAKCGDCALRTGP